MGAIVEVEVAVHFPFGVFDVDLAGWDPVLGNPGERVVDRPRRFGGDDHDLVAFLGELPKGIDRAGIGVEVPEERMPVMILCPLPERTHVFEVGETGDGVPRLDRINRQLGAVLLVVAANPTGIEVGHDTIEVYTQSHTREGKTLRFINGFGPSSLLRGPGARGSNLPGTARPDTASHPRPPRTGWSSAATGRGRSSP